VLPDNVPTLARVAPEPRGNGASASIRRRGPRLGGMVRIHKRFVSVVTEREPNMLRGSRCSEYGGWPFRRHGCLTLPAYRPDLTHRVIPAEQDKSVPLPPTGGKGTSQDEPMAMRTAGQGESECCSVMGQILVASALPTTSPGAKASRLP
jgi:hypothetical protein